jgi:hypothetical protein
MHALRLTAGSGVGQVTLSVELVKIFRAGLEGFYDCAMISIGEAFHWKKFTAAAKQVQADGAGQGSPQKKLPAAICQPVSTDAGFFRQSFGG